MEEGGCKLINIFTKLDEVQKKFAKDSILMTVSENLKNIPNEFRSHVASFNIIERYLFFGNDQSQPIYNNLNHIDKKLLEKYFGALKFDPNDFFTSELLLKSEMVTRTINLDIESVVREDEHIFFDFLGQLVSPYHMLTNSDLAKMLAMFIGYDVPADKSSRVCDILTRHLKSFETVIYVDYILKLQIVA